MCKYDMGTCSEKNLKELSYMIQTHQIQTLSKVKMKQVLKRPKIRYLHNVRSGRTEMFKKWQSRKRTKLQHPERITVSPLSASETLNSI